MKGRVGVQVASFATTNMNRSKRADPNNVTTEAAVNNGKK